MFCIQSSKYFVSLQGETYIIFYYLSRLDDLPIFKLEKEKQLHSLTKNNSAVHLPDLYRSCRSTSATWWKTETFSSFGTDLLRQSREKQVQRGSKYYDRFISEEKIFTYMTRNGSMLRDAILYFIIQGIVITLL